MLFRTVASRHARVLALGVTLLAAGCTDKPSPSRPIIEPDPDTAVGVSYATDIAPLFTTYGCINCHGALHGENRFSVATYESLFEPGFQAEERGVPPVKPGDPDSSYVVWKVVGEGGAGETINGFRMPVIGSYMAPADIELLRTWIAEGALDN